jgi:DNA helicase-2/ATP-dependent DNA helicase PcrA
LRQIRLVLGRIPSLADNGFQEASGRMSQILDGLNEAQRKAVSHIDGPLLTLAGPGTGKTRVVTHRIAHLLEQGISPYSILALTFTNKAAKEMKHRVARIVGENPIWMGTFHGYCARFLRYYGNMVGLKDNYTIFDVDDSKKALEEAIKLSGVLLSHLNFSDIARGIANLKNRAITPEMLHEPPRNAAESAVRKIYPVYQKYLLSNNAVDFDDLLMHTATIIRTNEDLRADLDSKHRYVLVDEYQDTNLAQYLIVRGLSIDHPNINVTGDPDQSIYGWRGADIGNILNFERDYPGLAVVRLQENYRSTPQILSAADQLISCNIHRKAKMLIPTRSDGSKIRLCSYASAKDEAEHIADQIAKHIIEETAKPKDFAVLYRTNAHSRLFEQALMRRRITYQLIGGFRFYQRQEIRDLIAYLRLVNNPEDDISFKRVVNLPPRGLGDKAIQSVTELARSRDISMIVALRAAIDHGMLSKKAQLGAREFLNIYERLVDLSGESIVAMLEHLLEATNYIEYLAGKKSEAPDESVKENVGELLADAQDKDSLLGQGGGLQQFLEEISLASDTDNITDENRVTLMTLHSAKGLEFDNVFVVAVEQDVLPHARSKSDPAQLEEERRLFFVGITRAKRELQISNASSRGFGNSRMGCPSQFLMELPRAEMAVLDYTRANPRDIAWSDQPSGDFFDSGDWDINQDVPGEDSFDEAPRSLKQGSKKKPKTYIDSSDSSDGFDEYCQEPRADRSKTFGGLKTGSSIGASITLAGTPVDHFEDGTRISHPRYGLGNVVSVEGFGPKRMARISFDNGEVKSFQLSKSPIDIV